MVCFARFDLEMCSAPQWRALFWHHNFQKWSDVGVLCAFWLGHVLRGTTACTFSTSQLPKVLQTWGAFTFFTCKCASRHSGVQLFISYLTTWLCTHCFSEPTFRPSGATNHWKSTVFRYFATFSRTCIFFPLTLSLLSSSLFCSSLLWLFPPLLFHLSILSEVWLLNFLRLSYRIQYIEMRLWIGWFLECKEKHQSSSAFSWTWKTPRQQIVGVRAPSGMSSLRSHCALAETDILIAGGLSLDILEYFWTGSEFTNVKDATILHSLWPSFDWRPWQTLSNDHTKYLWCYRCRCLSLPPAVILMMLKIWLELAGLSDGGGGMCHLAPHDVGDTCDSADANPPRASPADMLSGCLSTCQLLCTPWGSATVH